tara:strand:- start:13230 stop:14003 length:774 start_codon:yes stop_codon:yes gene_type:complete
MKKKYFFKPILFLAPLTIFALMSLSGGRDGGFSGSPGDGGFSCAQCHGGGNFGANAIIRTTIPISGYELNTAYNITITATSSAPKHGFQLTAEKDSDNSKVGVFTSGFTNQVVNSGTHVTHTDSNNSIWSFTWTSPATNQGSVSFYAAVAAANGNFNIGGDQVVTTSLSQPSLSISEAKLLKFVMYPNPTVDEINIQLPTGTRTANASIFDYTGRLIKSQEVNLSNSKIDVTSISKGMYIIRVTTDTKIGAQQFIKS